MSSEARTNWGKAYMGKTVTYIENPKNTIDLEQKWNYEVIRSQVAEYLPAIMNPKVIEVGCGGARNSLYLALHGIDVTCSDYSEEAIRLAQSNFEAFGAKGTFLLDDFLNSKVPRDSFDCVMSFGLLEHFPDLKPVIDSLTRLTKPGGIQIHLVIPKKFSTQTLMDILFFPFKLFTNLVLKRLPLKGILKRSYRNFPHFENRFTWHEYCQAFEESGNEVIKCEPGGLLIPFTYWTKYAKLGMPVMKLFGKQILRINEKVRNSNSPFIYRMSQTFTVIGRKNQGKAARL